MRTYRSRDIRKIRRAGRAAAGTLQLAGGVLAPGVRAGDIDRLVRADTARRGGRPSQLGYHGFPASVCVSPNDVVCHGVPTDDVVFEAGDIVNIDITTELDGFHGDTSRTFAVGPLGPEATHVVEVAQRCLQAGIDAVRPGAFLGDIGAAIAALAALQGCSVVRDYGGHGIGRQMHEPPHVHHVAEPGSGPMLREGMVFTIEPMINLGSPEVKVLADQWTVVTRDGAWSAQFEHTVTVVAGGVEILTLP